VYRSGHGFARLERPLAGEHFVQQTAERPSVSARIHGFATGLLGLM
jgi:hypothetical protein